MAFRKEDTNSPQASGMTLWKFVILEHPYRETPQNRGESDPGLRFGLRLGNR